MSLVVSRKGNEALAELCQVKNFKKQARKKLEDSTNQRQVLFRMQSGSRAGDFSQLCLQPHRYRGLLKC